MASTLMHHWLIRLLADYHTAFILKVNSGGDSEKYLPPPGIYIAFSCLTCHGCKLYIL